MKSSAAEFKKDVNKVANIEKLLAMKYSLIPRYERLKTKETSTAEEIIRILMPSIFVAFSFLQIMIIARTMQAIAITSLKQA